MARLDAELHHLLATRATHQRAPGDSPPEEDKNLQVAITFTDDVSDLTPLGFNPSDVIGSIAYGTIDLNTLEKLASNPFVISIELQRPNVIQLDKSVPDIQANSVWARNGDTFTGYTGKDVIIGIIDSGIDFRHRNFRKPDGSTRILKIWDQTIIAPVNPPIGAETIPGPIAGPFAAALGYGVVYDKPQINETLTNSSPATAVRHLDTNGHGTHVAGIAAGNGKQAGGCHGEYHYIGVAPHADLVIVRLWGLSKGDKGELMKPPASPKLNAPSNTVVQDALRFIFNEAQNQGKAVVINCSFGLFSEKMDNTDAVSQAINTMLTNNSTGRSVVFAAGNDGDAKFHAKGIIPASGSPPTVLDFKIFGQDTKRRSITIVYS
ncbi:MAG: S8 family serine peptidase, partial [Saprospiraceae bacterium]